MSKLDARQLSQAFGGDPRTRVRQLLATERDAVRAHAVLARGRAHELAPARADVQQRHPRRQVELAQDVRHLLALCLLERVARVAKVGARVGHRPIQPETVEVVAEVVVATHVRGLSALAGARLACTALELAGPAVNLAVGGSQVPELGEVAVDRDLAVHVALTEAEVDVATDRPRRTLAQQPDVQPRFRSEALALTIPIGDRQAPGPDARKERSTNLLLEHANLPDAMCPILPVQSPMVSRRGSIGR